MLFIAFLFAFSVSRPGTVYQPLRDISWASCNRDSFTVGDGYNNYTVNYTYCTSEGTISSYFIDKNVESMSALALDFIQELGLSKNECRRNSNLEIYQVSMDVLNNPNRFFQWQAGNPNTSTIWALYDARVPDSNVSSIMLTSHSGWDHVNFAHELSHYWYDRLCLGSQYNYQIEPFAERFQEYYKARTGR